MNAQLSASPWARTAWAARAVCANRADPHAFCSEHHVKPTLSSVLAAVSLSIVPASHAADLKKFDDAAIDALLAGVGATDITKETSEQGPFRIFVVGELKYVVAPRVCKPDTGCLGLLIQCTFSGEGFTTNSANTFNLLHAFSNAAVSPDRKSFYLGRYLIADGGFTIANAIENFKVFATLPAQLREQVRQDSSAPIASVQPRTTPAAASAPSAMVAVAAAGSVSAHAVGAKAGDWVVGEAHANKMTR